MVSLWEKVGGEAALRAIIEEFVDRVFDDLMIGFLFRNADPKRIKAMEYEHAAEWLGAPLRYSGRQLRAAHKPHRITGGQFMRRIQILKEVLTKHGVATDLSQAWIAHQEKLRSEITQDKSSECHKINPDKA